MEVVVPDSWVKLMREQATAPDTTPFLKNAQEMFPEDDEEFTMHILKHGVRRNIREALQELLHCLRSGLYPQPASATVIDRSPPANVEPVLATLVAETIPA